MALFPEPFWRVLRRMTFFLAHLAGLAIMAMILITVSDVVLRIFGKSLFGAYDLVRIAGVIAITCSLPYVTAVKGHIAIEFLHQRFSRRGRLIMDSIFRLIAIALFGLLVYRCWQYGLLLLKSSQVMPTLSIPIFWIPWMSAISFVFVLIATLYHLSHPGREFIKL